MSQQLFGQSEQRNMRFACCEETFGIFPHQLEKSCELFYETTTSRLEFDENKVF